MDSHTRLEFPFRSFRRPTPGQLLLTAVLIYLLGVGLVIVGSSLR